jgi:membrane-associated phospholipid phosphatase
MNQGLPVSDSVSEAAAVAGNRMRPVDVLTVAYLGVMLIPLLLSASVPRAALLAGVHAAGIVAILAARRSGIHRTRIGDWVLAFYPVPLFGLFYAEVGILIEWIHGGVLHDPAIQSLEGLVFGGQPSRTLHQNFPSRLLGDYLHLGYTSYYFLAPVLVGVLWLRRSRAEYDMAIATVALSFYVCFAIFVAYPVAGPHPPVDEVGVLIPGLTRWILDRGSSIGAAFPSSHVAVAVAIWITAIRYHRKLAVVFAFLVPALAVGSVYGGYHYAVDALGGAVVGVIVGTVGHGLLARIR